MFPHFNEKLRFQISLVWTAFSIRYVFGRQCFRVSVECPEWQAQGRHNRRDKLRLLFSGLMWTGWRRFCLSSSLETLMKTKTVSKVEPSEIASFWKRSRRAERVTDTCHHCRYHSNISVSERFSTNDRQTPIKMSVFSTENALRPRQTMTHCCSWCFLGCANWETFVADTKCFWTKSETFFVSRTQNLCPQQMLRGRANGETFVSATMCPQQCVLVCQGLLV